ncbi:hypothetical protein MXD61_27140 [Frankia sp. AgPm24]|uniref:hypothetical protein n=1 Tax=Frankia sp. AgPm24 TaxID=631128 RepID=UPI0020103E7F|nr:hypothetical protein [Frankia sp. AgPm24]MCK9925505.1 hypothetical protein [Frankia sp. AgPm24]
MAEHVQPPATRAVRVGADALDGLTRAAVGGSLLFEQRQHPLGAEVTVDASNATQFASWDGEGGAFWAVHADRFDEGVAAYRDRFLAAAAIEETATVLDVPNASTSQT